MKMRNPFEYGRELGLDELVDREEELTQIARTIRNRGKLFVIGPRRFGKTSLLTASAEAARARAVIVLQQDAEKYETLELLARSILTEAARALRGPMEQTAELIRGVAARLRPEIELDPMDGSIVVRIGTTARETGGLPLLADALDAVDELARRSEREVAVILDEVQAIVVEHGLPAERQLRSTIQRHRNVGYIFAGSDTRLLTAMTSDANRPFYRLGSRIFTGAIPREDFLPFLERGFRDGGFDVRPSACERILNRAVDVPYNVQRLAHEAWEGLDSGLADAFTAEFVDASLERIVRREDPAYTQIWTSLTTNQKKVLKAVIEAAGVNLLSGNVTRRIGLAASSVSGALTALQDRHLVRRTIGGREQKYRLVDPFLSGWLDVVQKV